MAEDGDEIPSGIDNERALFFRLLAILASDETTDEQRLRIYEAAEKIAAETVKADNPDDDDEDRAGSLPLANETDEE